MTEKEKMFSGDLYLPGDDEIMEEQLKCLDMLYDFNQTRDSAPQYIGTGVKMGEGWLLTAEMGELISHGVKNIVCTQLLLMRHRLMEC